MARKMKDSGIESVSYTHLIAVRVPGRYRHQIQCDRRRQPVAVLVVGVVAAQLRTPRGRVHPVSYTHLDVYKRQLLCCSMTGWYLTRVNNKLSKFMNLLIVFSMVVPFQMVMFTLSKTADQLKLNTPWNICIIYLGFGAGLAVFMFTGFMKSVPMEIEEAAMIDGCNPIQIFFKVVFPILKPTMISTAILETMWVWNDYLLPTLVLDIKKYRTIPMAIQYFRGGYGRVELAPMMACIIIAIIPIIILYMTCQKYIIEGVVAGAVKG